MVLGFLRGWHCGGRGGLRLWDFRACGGSRLEEPKAERAAGSGSFHGMSRDGTMIHSILVSFLSTLKIGSAFKNS